MKFVYMVHKETGASHEFPDQPNVIIHQEARGWKVADRPEAKPFVSKHLDIDPVDEWVTLIHPDLNTTHEFPNNPEAIEGAYDSGWELPASEKVADEEKPKKAPAKKAATTKPVDDDKEKVN